jgi:hypothetical protein
MSSVSGLVACRIAARDREHVAAQRLAGLPAASPPMPAPREAQVPPP